MTTKTLTLSRLLSEPQWQRICGEFGIGAEAPEAQEQAIAAIEKAVMAHLFAAIGKRIPAKHRGALEDAMTSGDSDALIAFLTEHIPDLDVLVQNETRAAFDAIKKRAQELEGEA